MHPLQLNANDEHLSAPYKIAKTDLRALPANVQDKILCLPSASSEIINEASYQYSPPQTQLVLGTSQQSRSQDAQRFRPSCLNRLQHFEVRRILPYALRNEPAGLGALALLSGTFSRISVVSTTSDAGPDALNCETK
ncbi:hypothetical protein D915_009583 [Fasciola hepatica]|uniref:Uncharacterized protein n=1 Tax=Fasciola hepatica TaxID=6192 RepID=A0A2H1BUU6_FASHE|nr:hypothetical protein D915_009583 [Fasciola hepatica]